MILALLLSAAAPPPVIAVLEFRDRVPPELRIDAAYLSDQVRAAAKESLPQARIITRENMLVLLKTSGKDLANCEGECEVDTGRRIGADLVVSGELLRFGSQYKLNMKLHDTREGSLLSGAVASGATADELDRALRPAADKLLASLRMGAGQDALSDRRAAAGEEERPPVERPRDFPRLAFTVWTLLGYASDSRSTGLTSTSAIAEASDGGFAYCFGGSMWLHVAGPVYLGALGDYGFFPPPKSNEGKGDGLLLGGGARVVVGGTALSAGLGRSSLGNNAGNGVAALAAVDLALSGFAWRFQVTWHRARVSAIDQTTTVVAAEVGLSLTF
jgi:hypothetical protein